MLDFNWKWRDLSHIEAHKKDFIVDIDNLLKKIKPKIKEESNRRNGTWVKKDFDLEIEVGYTGLKAADETSFWAFRNSRSIPSHLILGIKVRTSFLCIWGYWQDHNFVIHTIYPGTVAPKEIHDKDLQLGEIDSSIKFWSKNCIIVKEGEYSWNPEKLKV